MDINKLRTLVFEKTGIKIDTGDPIFALVALNEAVLAEYVAEQVAALHQAAEKLSEQTGQLQQAGALYENVLRQLAAKSETEPAANMAAALANENNPKKSGRRSLATGDLSLWQVLAGAGGIALLCAMLTLAGLSMFGHRNAPPQEPPKPVLYAPVPAALTPEQTKLIQDGEKFARILPKLDANTQAKIQRLLQQP